ncbi:MAG TPA: hypothetical protein VJ914_38700 [Pseudonocardiaceae bacterium]|nr:hypothetical protein [Pseudonocardiaceae bacterium]
MTVRMYAKRKQWPRDQVTVALRHPRPIRFDGGLDDEQRRRLLAITDKCPAHRTPRLEIQIITDEWQRAGWTDQ